MKALFLSMSVMLFAALGSVWLCGCSREQDADKTSPPGSSPTEGNPPEESVEEVRPRPLEEVIAGVWQTVDPRQLESKEIEKITIDFRADGRFTIDIHRPNPGSQSGSYEVAGDELTMRADNMPDNEIETAYDAASGILTVTDNDQSVDFRKL